MSEHVARLTAIRDFWLPLSKDSSEDVQVILADIDAVLVDLERAQAELAEAKRDAARYRWLRGDSCADHSVRWTQWEVRCWSAPTWSHDLRRGDLDAAIDAAIRTENTDAR